MTTLTAADESYSAVQGVQIQRPSLGDEEPHPRVSGEGQIQGGVKAMRIMQDLTIRDKRKESEALADPGSSKRDLDTTSWEGRGFKPAGTKSDHSNEPRHPQKTTLQLSKQEDE
ncbi:hypothetical protein VZT92_001658 [Zoarces viviparus]|uniref:Uncharacterized protein n=1 Tax=Zoarces viviparus TaxID=48416 RepID=A0AAW1G538_ZOAVI